MYKQIIERSGLTQYAAANKLGISYQLMNYYHKSKSFDFNKVIFFMKGLEVKEMDFETENCTIKIELK